MVLHCKLRNSSSCFLGHQQQRCFASVIPGMTRKTREKDYERLVDSEKAYKKFMALKEVLTKEPENVICLSELRNSKFHVSPTGRHRLMTLITKYNSIFKLCKDDVGNIWCGFSPDAQALVDKELALRKSYEAVAVQKVRKLLMMSVDRRIRIPKLAQLARDLGLPHDFQSRFVFAYPQYFKVVNERFKHQQEPVLELTSWDSALAVTALETRAQATGEVNEAEEPLFRMRVSDNIRLSKKQQEGLEKFQQRTFISPYVDCKDFNKKTLEFEKRQVILLHEILSMTMEKKTVFDYLTHFRKEYMLPQSLLAIVLRYHSIFYVSRKGGRFVIFLKEAYEGGNFVEKNEWSLLKQQYTALMQQPKLRRVDFDSSMQLNKLDSSDLKVFYEDQQDDDIDALMDLFRKMEVDDFISSQKGNSHMDSTEEMKKSKVHHIFSKEDLSSKPLESTHCNFSDLDNDEDSEDLFNVSTPSTDEDEV